MAVADAIAKSVNRLRNRKIDLRYRYNQLKVIESLSPAATVRVVVGNDHLSHAGRLNWHVDLLNKRIAVFLLDRVTHDLPIKIGNQTNCISLSLDEGNLRPYWLRVELGLAGVRVPSALRVQKFRALAPLIAKISRPYSSRRSCSDHVLRHFENTIRD